MLKRVLLFCAVGMLVFVGIAGRFTFHVVREIDGEFDAEFAEALNLPEEITVTQRLNGDTVFSERIDTHDDNHDFDFDMDNEVEIDDIDSIDFDFGDDGLTFELSGTNDEGEAVTISADLTQGNDSVVNIDIEK